MILQLVHIYSKHHEKLSNNKEKLEDAITDTCAR